MTRAPIPAKIHQIYWPWGSDGVFLADEYSIPPLPHTLAWQALHPDFAYHLWTRSESFAWVERCYPDLWPMFQRLPYHIQRCDVFRLMLLAREGGIYADVDLAVTQPCSRLLANYGNMAAVFATETILSPQAVLSTSTLPIRHGEPEHPIRLANFWMAAAPHPILTSMLEEAVNRSALPIREPYDIIYTTGPDVVTSVVHRERENYNDVIYIPQREAELYFTHDIEGSWRQHI